jgi:putative membrane protein insertion efficiency factor
VSAHPGRPARITLGFVHAYQRWLSPILPPTCRYWPSCSEYARLVVARHGLGRGGLLTIGRLLRCQPLFSGGIDLPR